LVRGEALAQSGIVGMREESVAKRKQRVVDADAQAFARGFALLIAGFTPAFEG
jgi:hypothetical protein